MPQLVRPQQPQHHLQQDIIAFAIQTVLAWDYVDIIIPIRLMEYYLLLDHMQHQEYVQAIVMLVVHYKIWVYLLINKEN